MARDLYWTVGWRHGDAVGSSHGRVHAVFYKYVTFY